MRNEEITFWLDRTAVCEDLYNTTSLMHSFNKKANLFNALSLCLSVAHTDTQTQQILIAESVWV